MTERTKTPIEQEDIRPGDLIRAEWPDGESATERRVSEGFHFRDDKKLFLLDRPKPPFKPYWGMVIGFPEETGPRAAYVGCAPDDPNPWTGDFGRRDSDWAEQKLAEGWIVIEKPDWAPEKEDVA